MIFEVPPPIVTRHGAVSIVRDDLVLGGTKARVAQALALTAGAEELVYAGPAQGYAQVAMGVVAASGIARATCFVPASKVPNPLSVAAARLGAKIIPVPYGRLTVLKKRARDYCTETGAINVPMGLRLDGIDRLLTLEAASLPEPAEAWVAVGSGSVASALSYAWPNTPIRGVIVGAEPTVTRDRIVYHRVPEPFTTPNASTQPPCPSLDTYDAKVWRYLSVAPTPGALWWNVGGPPPTESEIRHCLSNRTLALPRSR